MITFTQEHQELYGDIFTFTPFHRDACEHNKETDYLCSFQTYASKIQRAEKYDFYLYEDRDGKHLCLRFGSECSEYCSPGHVVEFLLRNNSSSPIGNHYEMAKWILLNYGKLSYSLNT